MTSVSFITSPPSHCRYNKREGDFPGLREYNDYLEQVEDIGMAPASNGHLKMVLNGFMVLSFMGISHSEITLKEALLDILVQIFH